MLSRVKIDKLPLVQRARINWEGCARKDIQRKMVGMAEVGVPVSQKGVSVHPDCWVGASACVIFILLQKNQKMANKDMTCGYHPVGAPTCQRKQEVGKPSWNAAQPHARAQGCVNDDCHECGFSPLIFHVSVCGLTFFRGTLYTAGCSEEWRVLPSWLIYLVAACLARWLHVSVENLSRQWCRLSAWFPERSGRIWKVIDYKRSGSHVGLGIMRICRRACVRPVDFWSSHV